MADRDNPVGSEEYGNSKVGRGPGDAERRREARGSEGEGQPQPPRTSKEELLERTARAQRQKGEAKVPSAPPITESRERPKGH